MSGVCALQFADIDHAHPDVENDILRWGKWIIEETGAAGVSAE